MAISLTKTAQNSTTVVWSVKCLDADTGPTTFAHGLEQTPTELIFTPAISTAIAANGMFSLTADATNVSVTKINVAGSGGTTPGTTVVGNVVAKIVPSNI